MPRSIGSSTAASAQKLGAFLRGGLTGLIEVSEQSRNLMEHFTTPLILRFLIDHRAPLRVSMTKGETVASGARPFLFGAVR